MKKKLTLEQEITYMRIALSLSGVACNNRGAEMIIMSHRGILEKGGEFSIKDSAKIEAALEQKYSSKEDKQQ